MVAGSPKPPRSAPMPTYSLGEEVAHAITHGVGGVLALLGLGILIAPVVLHRSTLHVVGCAVYGVTLLLLYLASTLYHAVPARKVRTKWWMQRLDHAAIYLFIAGTYTPFSLFALADPWGMRVFGAIWTLAILGIVVIATPLRRYERLSLSLYLLMGWLAILVAKPLIDSLPWPALALLLAGGIAYTLGVVFFVRDRKWSHTVWHGFVLAGSGLHFLAILAVL